MAVLQPNEDYAQAAASRQFVEGSERRHKVKLSTKFKVLNLTHAIRRLFLLWYQALGDQSPDGLHAIFATLVPGFPTPKLGDRFSAMCTDTPYTMFQDNIEGQNCYPFVDGI
jgi:hypothetical protein